MKSEPGWCYILSHPVWSRLGGTGAVKIGKTRHDPTKRSLQIASSSGLLRQPTVEWCVWVADCGAVEMAVHQQLARYRISRRRELFAVPVATAKAVIEGATTVRSVNLRPRVTYRRRRRNATQARLWGVLMLSAAVIIFAIRHFN